MKRYAFPTVLAVFLLGACSAGYDVTPVTKHTPDRQPDCFVIERYDEGAEDGLGEENLGMYCKAQTPTTTTTVVKPE